MFGSDQSLNIIISAKDQASKTIADLKGNLERMRPTFQKMAVVGTAAFVGIAAGIKSSIDAAAEAAQVQAQLGAVLKSTGGVAGVTKDQAMALANELQRMSTYSDEAILSAENMLLTFTNIGKDVFPDALKTVLDMSTALGQDLKSSSIQLGKALNNPVEGITALQRVGVNFTDKQKEMIEAMVEAGDVMGAQKFILQELATEFGGSAAAQAETFAGKMAQLKNRFGEIQEAVGNAFIPVLNTLMEKVAPIIEKIIAWVEANPKLTANIVLVAGAIAGLTAVLGGLGLILPVIIAMFGMLAAASGPIAIIIAIIGMLIPLIQLLVQHWDILKEGAVTAFQNIGETILLYWSVIKTTFDTWGIRLQLLGNTILGFWDGVKKAFREGVNFLVTLAEGWANVWVQAANTIIGALNKIKFSVPSWVPGIGGKSFGINIPLAQEVKLPRFEHGGIIPGSPGSAVPVIAHAGERIVPASRSRGMSDGTSISININYPQFKSQEDVELVRMQIEQALRDVIRLYKLQPS